GIRDPLVTGVQTCALPICNSFPCYGSALSSLLPGRKGVPGHVALPHLMYNVVVLPGQNAGFLGAAFNPLQLARDPNETNFHVERSEERRVGKDGGCRWTR